MIKTKIAEIHLQGEEGNVVVISGTVKKVKPVSEPKQGKNGPFTTQEVYVVDGPKTEDYSNSIFCNFYNDNGTYEYLQGQTVTIQGKVHLWGNRKSLQGCRVLTGNNPPANSATPPQTRSTGQSGSLGGMSDEKELRISRLALVKSGIESNQLECKTPKAIEFWLDYVYNGLEKEPVEPYEVPSWQEPDTPEPEYGIDDDIPF